jgi:hypothetical protein
MVLTNHYVVGTTGSFSHCPSVVNLCLAFLTEDPDLLISVLLHANNVPNSEALAAKHAADIRDRLKFYPLGEANTGSMRQATDTFMTMVYKSGEAYGTILGACTFPLSSLSLS